MQLFKSHPYFLLYVAFSLLDVVECTSNSLKPLHTMKVAVLLAYVECSGLAVVQDTSNAEKHVIV